MDLKFILESLLFSVGTTPTGLHHSAQGWPRQRTTLGKRSKIFSNPNGVVSFPRRALMQPLQGCCRLSRQPWAERFESFQDSSELALHRCGPPPQYFEILLNSWN